MSDKTKISWTDATLGVWYGCTKVSAGCKHCYAIDVVGGLPRKFEGKNPEAFEFYSGIVADGNWTGAVKMHEGHLALPLQWRSPKKIFVNSMTDVFHDAIPDAQIARLWAMMATATQHTYQILTKRPARMQALLSTPSFYDLVKQQGTNFAKEHYTTPWADRCLEKMENLTHSPMPLLSHVWLGVSVEDQEAADKRIPILLQTPAAVRFLSCEPLLGPVDLQYAAFNGADSLTSLEGLHWVIVGGESGSNFRPMALSWAQSLRDQCLKARVSFFFKQQSAVKSGTRPYLPDANGVNYQWHQFPGELAKPVQVSA